MADAGEPEALGGNGGKGICPGGGAAPGGMFGGGNGMFGGMPRPPAIEVVRCVLSAEGLLMGNLRAPGAPGMAKGGGGIPPPSKCQLFHQSPDQAIDKPGNGKGGGAPKPPGAPRGWNMGFAWPSAAYEEVMESMTLWAFS